MIKGLPAIVKTILELPNVQYIIGKKKKKKVQMIILTLC